VDVVAAFRRDLGERGVIEGRNVLVEFRWANGDYARLPALAADLVGRPVLRKKLRAAVGAIRNSAIGAGGMTAGELRHLIELRSATRPLDPIPLAAISCSDGFS
jgi:hypothetical protein